MQCTLPTYIMTLKEVISQIDLTAAYDRFGYTPDWESLSQELRVEGLYWSEDTRLRVYPITSHICTDTEVGLFALFLDNEWVGISMQAYRKSSVEYSFVSREKAEILQQYLMSLVGENPLDNITLLNTDEEIGTGYRLAFTGEVFRHYHKTARILAAIDEPVEVLGPATKDIIEQKFRVKTANGDVKIVHVNDLEFDFIPLLPKK
jgi:hypothetical protein